MVATAKTSGEESDITANMSWSRESAALADITVVEWGEHISAPYAARLLAELGARVIKVEGAGRCGQRAGGDAATIECAENPLLSVLNWGKELVGLHEEASRASEQLRQLLHEASIFITNMRHDVLQRYEVDAKALRAAYPNLVVVTVSAFGEDGPLADMEGPSLFSSALAGASWAIGEIGRPPLTLPYDLADYEGGVNAAGAALAALRARERSGSGQHVDVAVADILASYVATNSLIYETAGKPWGREGRRAAGSGGPYPYTLFRCGDGYVALIGRSQEEWKRILAAVGQPCWSKDPRYQDPYVISESFADEVDALLAPWFRERTRAELLEIGKKFGIGLAPVNSTREVVDEPQFIEREAFRDLRIDGADVAVPVAPWRFSTSMDCGM